MMLQQTSFTLLLLLISQSAHGLEPDPIWHVTCNKDLMTIVATAPDSFPTDYFYDNKVPRLAIDSGTDDETNTCATVLSLSECGVTDTGPCVSTLLVDLTDAAYYDPTNNCVPNERPADVNDDPRLYSKLVMWQTARHVNTDTDFMDPNGDTLYDSTNSLRLFSITCLMQASYQLELDTSETPEVIIELLNPIEPYPFMVEHPLPTIAVTDTSNAPLGTVYLGREIRLRVGFQDPSNTAYWNNLVVNKCVASTTSGIDLLSPVTEREVTIIDLKCPPTDFSIDGRQIVTNYEYTKTDLVNNEVERMNLDFKAFRIGTVQSIYFICQVTICPDPLDQGTEPLVCQKPTIDVGATTCTTPTPRRRYENVMMIRNNKPESITSTVSTVILIESDTVIVDSEGQVAAGYTCLTTGTFTAVIAILSVLCLISVAVTVTVCIQTRGRSAPGKSSAMDLPPVGYNNYSVSKHSLNA